LIRPLDRHLDSDELDALVASQAPGVSVAGRLSEDAVRDAQRHVESCQDCDRKVQMHRSAQSAISLRAMSGQTAKGPNCSDESDWVRVAAGLLGETEAKERMNHAAQCGNCGPLLKAAARNLFDETTPDEEAALANLTSARPEWQSQMARTLRSAGEPRQAKEAIQFWKALFLWPRPAFAAAALAVLVATVWVGVRTLRPPSAEQLLALAYTERRTMEVRIPGAKYAPIRVERTGAGSNFDKPQSLLKAEALISENLQSRPNDPVWLEAKARAEMLDGNYEEAIKTVQRALESRPDSSDLLTDLGSAYYLRAKSANRPIDYGNAIEQLGKALAKNPDNPIALFNRALACEEMLLYAQAIDDWEHYLRLDGQGDWSEEAHRRLSALQERLKLHQRSQEEPLLEPAEIARGADEGMRSRIDERIEEYFNVAVKQWLPKAYPPGDTDDRTVEDFRAALKVVAELAAEKHRDQWLRDVLSVLPSKNFSSGVIELAHAMELSEQGDFASGKRFAEEAETHFRAAGNGAAMLRARYERVYALHLAQEGASCLRVVSDFPPLDSLTYRWLRIQLRLEQGTCEWVVGDLGRAREHYRYALKDAEASGYIAVYLRAINHLAGIDSASGNEVSSWNQAQRALRLYWSATVPAMQAYNLYFDLHEVADWIREPHLDVAVWRQEIATIDTTPDVLLRATAHSYLGKAALNADMPAVAQIELQKAADIFAVAPQSQPTRIARIEALTRIAKTEVLQGQIVPALDRLSVLRSAVSNLSDNLLALIFYEALGEAELRRGSLDNADSDLRSAVTLAEMNVKSLQNEESRSRWAAEGQSAYRSLAELRLLQGNQQGALEIWEWYRGVALRSTLHPSARTLLPSPDRLADGPALPPMNVVSSRISTITRDSILTYAVFNGGIEVWEYDNRGVTSHWIAIPLKQLRQLALRFRNSCKDPSSDIRNLRRDAHLLYDLLVSPVEQTFSTGRRLVIETDDVLGEVPFEALMDKQERYLVDRFPIVSTFGLYYDDVLHRDTQMSRDAPVLVASVPSPRTNEEEVLPVLTDAEGEARAVAAMFRSPSLLLGDESTLNELRVRLPRASIFHFSGHAVTSASHAGILLSDGLLEASSIQPDAVSNLQLAVLSACETERGTSESAEDTDSLVRFLARARVPHVLASRWRVDSTATRSLIQAFYAALLTGRSVSESLQAAEIGLKAQPGLEHPYFWSSFRVFGRA